MYERRGKKGISRRQGISSMYEIRESRVFRRFHLEFCAMEECILVEKSRPSGKAGLFIYFMFTEEHSPCNPLFQSWISQSELQSLHNHRQIHLSKNIQRNNCTNLNLIQWTFIQSTYAEQIQWLEKKIRNHKLITHEEDFQLLES